jgi:hypothetical protein
MKEKNRQTPPADRVIYEKEGWHRLLDQGGLVLEVLIGTVAAYVVRMRLSDEEQDRYRREGAAYIDELARDVLTHEPRYREQGRTTPL